MSYVCVSGVVMLLLHHLLIFYVAVVTSETGFVRWFAALQATSSVRGNMIALALRRRFDG
jgi:hypothetical protein